MLDRGGGKHNGRTKHAPILANHGMVEFGLVRVCVRTLPWKRFPIGNLRCRTIGNSAIPVRTSRLASRKPLHVWFVHAETGGLDRGTIHDNHWNTKLLGSVSMGTRLRCLHVKIAQGPSQAKLRLLASPGIRARDPTQAADRPIQRWGQCGSSNSMRWRHLDGESQHQGGAPGRQAGWRRWAGGSGVPGVVVHRAPQGRKCGASCTTLRGQTGASCTNSGTEVVHHAPFRGRNAAGHRSLVCQSWRVELERGKRHRK
jgi:hypothetical protein